MLLGIISESFWKGLGGEGEERVPAWNLTVGGITSGGRPRTTLWWLVYGREEVGFYRNHNEE